MTNRFLISVATAALIAGTGFANAQGAGATQERLVPRRSRARLHLTAAAPPRRRNAARYRGPSGMKGAETGTKGVEPGTKASESTDKMAPEQERSGRQHAGREVEEHALRDRLAQGQQGHEGRGP